MPKLLSLGFVLIAAAASATPNHICVRNYLKGQAGYDPCANLPGYVYAKPAPGEADQKICARAYPSFYCQMAKKTYVTIPSTSGTKFCTVDYNQPGVVDYCKSVPKYYDYVSGAEEEQDAEAAISSSSGSDGW